MMLGQYPTLPPAARFALAGFAPTGAMPAPPMTAPPGTILGQIAPGAKIPAPPGMNTLDELNALINAYRASADVQPYNPPPPVMVNPNVSKWAMIAAALLGGADRTGTVVPAITSGLMQGGQLASQHEAARRQAAVEAARARANADVGAAQIRYGHAQDLAKMAHEKTLLEQKGLQQLELQKERQNVEVIKGLMRQMPPSVRAQVASQYGIPGAQAWSELNAEEQLKGAQAGLANTRANEIKTMLPVKYDSAVAGAANTRSIIKERETMLPGKVEGQGLDNKGKALKNLNMERLYQLGAQYDGNERAAKLRKIETDIKKGLADANKALASAQHIAKTGGDWSPAQERIYSNNINSAQAAVTESEGALKAMDSMKVVWERRKAAAQAKVGSSNPEEAKIAAQTVSDAGAWLDTYAINREFLSSKLAEQRAALSRLTNLSPLPVDSSKIVSDASAAGNAVKDLMTGTFGPGSGKFAPPPRKAAPKTGSKPKSGGNVPKEGPDGVWRG